MLTVTDPSDQSNFCRPEVVFNFSAQSTWVWVLHLGLDKSGYRSSLRYCFKTLSVSLLDGWQSPTSLCGYDLVVRFIKSASEEGLMDSTAPSWWIWEWPLKSEWGSSWLPCLFSLHYNIGKTPDHEWSISLLSPKGKTTWGRAIAYLWARNKLLRLKATELLLPQQNLAEVD